MTIICHSEVVSRWATALAALALAAGCSADRVGGPGGEPASGAAAAAADAGVLASFGDDVTVAGAKPEDACLGAGGGETITFWTKKAGEQLVGSDDLEVLDALRLKDRDGADFDPTTYPALRTWLTRVTKANLAYVLSAQLAAMELNVLNGLVRGDAFISAPGASCAASGYATVSAVMAEADVELGAHPRTPIGSPFRQYQQVLVSALEGANGDATFVQEGGTCAGCTADADGDGTPDCFDECPLDPAKTRPGACACGVADVDTDADGMANCVDECPLDPGKVVAGVCGCGLPDTASSVADDDGDGVPNCRDRCPGWDDSVDTDGDGTPDCEDACPLDPAKTSPSVCGCSVADVDSDADGTADCIDGCPDDPAKVLPGICGCGIPDTAGGIVDTDGDSTPDCRDGCPIDPAKTSPGICGCGTPDENVADTDADGTPDCLDACPLDPAKTSPSVCGCGVADVDSNGNGIADCLEG